MGISTELNRYFARGIWNELPYGVQKSASLIWGKLYQTKASRRVVDYFLQRYHMTSDEMRKYVPASGASDYLTFQDFFTRKLVNPLRVTSEAIYPCEGMLCEVGPIDSFESVKVKSNQCVPRDVFGQMGADIPSEHIFYNIFLHNHNYHRFHAPVSGVVKRIEHIKGGLHFLRPWLYTRNTVSKPAFVNERVVIEIEDKSGEFWYLSFVGGMGVGQIRLTEPVRVGNAIHCGEEIGLFLLGSTCCMAVPKRKYNFQYLKSVELGSPL